MALPDPYWSDEDRGLRIFCGDCRDVLPEFADDQFGSVITDPPYGIGFADWDVPPDSAILQECLRVAEGTVVMFGGARVDSQKHFLDMTPDRTLVWHYHFGCKPGGTDGCCWTWQPVHVWRMGPQEGIPHDVIHCEHRHRDVRWHGTMKPEWLMVILLRAFGGLSSLDPYMGSGTTLVAAAKLGIPCTGVEIDETFCQMSVCRLQDGFVDDEPAHLFNQEARDDAGEAQ